jgi:hypothetical protein
MQDHDTNLKSQLTIPHGQGLCSRLFHPWPEQSICPLPLGETSHSSLRGWSHPSLRGWSHPSLQGYFSMSLEYPKLNTWTEANLGKFLIPLLYEGLFSFSFSTKVFSFSFSMKVYLWDCSFLLYEGLFLLYEGLDMGSKKSLVVQNLSMV